MDNVSAGLSSSSIVNDIKNNLGERKSISDFTLGEIGKFLSDKDNIKYIKDMWNHINVDAITIGTTLVGYGKMVNRYRRFINKNEISFYSEC